MQVYFAFALVACLASRVTEAALGSPSPAPLRRSAEAPSTSGCGQCAAADPCSRPDLVGLFCSPNTATVIAADPCDDSNQALSYRGWYCMRNTGTVLVVGDDFRNAGHLSWMRPAVPAGAEPGALILDPDYTVVQSVPCDATNPAVAGKWCEPNTANVVEQCKQCDGNKIGLTCRPERGGFGIVKYCMNGGVSATLDINKWVVKVDKYSFLFLPSHHLASMPPPTTDGHYGLPTWLFIMDITVGVLSLVALGSSVAICLDDAASFLGSISEDVEEVKSELSIASSLISSNFDYTFLENQHLPGNWQVVGFDATGNVLGAQNENVNVHNSAVGAIKLRNGFEVRW
jgi:hypothetical protein